MNEPNLLLICAIAFVAVMVLLGFEALVIGLIVRLFPARRSDHDVMTEVIQRAVAERFPGAAVVAVEEVNPDRN
jgi:hypothetical protein